MADKINDGELRCIAEGITRHIIQDSPDRLDRLAGQLDKPATPGLLTDHIVDLLKDPQTEGVFTNNNNHVYFYNPPANSIVIVGPDRGHGGSFMNLGSNADKGRTKFETQIKKIEANIGEKPHIYKNGINGVMDEFKAQHGQYPDLKSVNQHMDIKLKGLDFQNLGKNGGAFVGYGIGAGLAAHHLYNGEPVEAAKSVVDIVVPYGEAGRHLVNMEFGAAARSATIETASLAGGALGCVAGGLGMGVVGSVVPIAGTATGLAVGCLTGGAAGGIAFGSVAAHGVDKISDLFNAAADEFPPEGLEATGPAITADEVYAQLPDQVQPGMPPEVESLVLQPNRERFDAQFEEIKDYGGLPEIETYLEQEPKPQAPDIELDNTNLSQPTATVTPGFSLSAP